MIQKGEQWPTERSPLAPQMETKSFAEAGVDSELDVPAGKSLPDPNPNHFVQFYEDDDFLVQSVASFIGASLGSGEAALVVATPSHRAKISARLSAQGLDVPTLEKREQLNFWDAEATLERLMSGDSPDAKRFDGAVADTVARIVGQYGGLRVFGEMVATLCAAGNGKGAVELEGLWNDLGKRHPIKLLCAYPMNGFLEAASDEIFKGICSQHAVVISPESPCVEAGLETKDSFDRLRERAGSLEREITQRRNIEDELREQTRTLEILHRVSCALVAEQGLERVVQLVTDAGNELCGGEFGAFFYNVSDDKGESYTLYTITGVPREEFSRFPMPRNTEIFAPTFGGEGVVRIADVTKDPRYGRNSPNHGMPDGHLPVCSYLAVPVISNTGAVLGGLFFGHSNPGVFTEKSEQLILGLAAQAAIAIDNATLSEALQRELETVRLSEENSRTLAAIVRSSDDAIIGKDLNGIIRSWNPGAEKMFGYEASEVIGRPVTMLFPSNHINEEPTILAHIRAGRHVDHYETVRRRKDGTLINISLTVSPIRNAAGEIVGASKIVRDISRRKRDEEALAQATAALAIANEELEQRVTERTASLTEAIEQMEEFSYTVSHDLRAPLRAMHVYTNVLREDFGHLFASEPEAQMCVQKVAENCSRLDKMIRDVLAYGRIAREKLEIHPVSLDALVAEMLHNYPTLQPAQARVDVAALGTVLGHEPSLIQILSNLLNNAVKFVAPGTLPEVKVWTADSEDHITLWVEDNGIGIDPAYQHRLFTMFERIHPEQAYEGTGVGLAIVRKAAERMGGQVGAISSGTNGSRFWVKLPKAK